jgi:hypothetical protein
MLLLMADGFALSSLGLMGPQFQPKFPQIHAGVEAD